MTRFAPDALSNVKIDTGKNKAVSAQNAFTGLVLAATVSCLISLTGTPAFADENDDPLSSLRQCRQMADTEVKAACYDQAMDILDADRAANKFTIVTGKQMEGLERDAFGFQFPSLPKLRFWSKSDKPRVNALAETEPGTENTVVKKSKSGEILRVAYEVKRVSTLSNGHKKMYLSNGQVWEQISSNAPRFRGQPPYKVHIKKASLGSYLMVIEGSKITTRVRRTQ